MYLNLSRLGVIDYNVVTYRFNGICGLVEEILLNFIDVMQTKKVMTMNPPFAFLDENDEQTGFLLAKMHAARYELE